ncbi:TPA: hypothetical protein QCJ32_004597 [Enterobacter asburiae]|uniref:hypothetical protein n=1 Tax=Enterobacter hormaechei TaxID=158836 RepID=UPI0005EDAA05|nr:hypothetical protein [Enterobacter hormaechei]HCT5890667.1 hypothetical protein [Klebsiella pneumoniae]HDR2699889.1 hypothetical protein [Enterobacter asburiae]HEH2461132.1 hypothetical protein [Klebsiella oxytoca]HEJ0124909.1 hypothetical protein [Klebsiella aerogenes]KJN68822.1 hypothetical protein SS49_03240 [Enterobacter hormaechei subsp. steigerwaltii]
MKKIITVAAVCLLSFSSLAASSPISVSISPGSYSHYSSIRITSKVDSIVIKQLIVNRGNCQDAEFASPWKPVRLGFGGTVAHEFTGKGLMVPCNVLEVVVQTSEGAWQFDFDS